MRTPNSRLFASLNYSTYKSTYKGTYKDTYQGVRTPNSRSFASREYSTYKGTYKRTYKSTYKGTLKTHFRACAPQTAAPLPHASTPVPPEREGGWEVGKTEGQRDGERVCVWCVCVCVCITHTNPGTRRLWHTRNNIVPPSTPLRLTSAGSVSSAGTAAELAARHACARWGASGVCVGGVGVVGRRNTGQGCGTAYNGHIRTYTDI